MSYFSLALLSKQQESELKSKMGPLWLQGLKGKEIARRLKFGVPGSECEKLQSKYVYF